MAPSSSRPDVRESVSPPLTAVDPDLAIPGLLARRLAQDPHATLVERKRIPTTKKVVHGVAWSPDGRYAYISQESIGADAGAVDVLDLATLTVVSSFPVPQQPAGITILRQE